MRFSLNWSFIISGKCYNVPEDFLPRRHRKPKFEFEIESLKNTEVKQAKKLLTSESLQNIPAFLPYEAKQALLRELSRADRKLSDIKVNAAVEALEEVEQIQAEENQNQSDDEIHFDDSENDTNDPHFFYGNLPVMEFSLADGTSGSVRQTPRRRK